MQNTKHTMQNTMQSSVESAMQNVMQVTIQVQRCIAGFYMGIIHNIL